MDGTLIIQMAKLGDFIQSTPLLANLRRLWPGRMISLAAENPSVIEAARLSPLVDEIFDLNSKGLPGGLKFESVFVLNSHPRAAALADEVSCENHYGPRLVKGELQPTSAQNFLRAVMKQDRRLGRFNLADVWISLLPEAGPLPLQWPGAGPGARRGPFRLAFQMGSRSHLRRWPVENFVRLAQTLWAARPDIEITLFGGPDERALGRKFETLAAGGPPVANLIGRTDLKTLGETMSGQNLLITADTGVMHLAAAVGVQVLALFFGPAYGPETGPYGPGHLILQALAPCAPCLENACRRRSCLNLPPPELAAGLALKLIAAEPLELPDLPPDIRLWASRSDAFGQSLSPLGRPWLTEAEALALLLTEAGRKIIRPSYIPEAGNIDLGGYRRQPQTRPLNPGPLVNILQPACSADGRAETAAAIAALAADLGLEIASF